MDEVASYNARRWDSLVRAKALFTRPWLDLDQADPLARVDLDGRFGDVRGKRVLCLASGGGQQSAAFSLAGAHVTVVDISSGQIERDREAARHYGYEIEAVHGDMRDLSMFPPGRFDLVYHPFSINFVPDPRDVFAEVARVTRRGGLYELGAENPFAAGLGTDAWNGRAYELRGRYVQGTETVYRDEAWVFRQGEETQDVVPGRAYRHLLSTLVNGLAENGFGIRNLREEFAKDLTDDPEPGSWAHFTLTIPPWLTLLAEKVESGGRTGHPQG